MIVTKDIEEILIRDMGKVMPVNQIFVEDDIPTGEIKEERVTIHTKELRPDTYFSKCFVEVNWCVPDIGESPDSTRLQSVERIMAGSLESNGEYDGSAYRYEVYNHKVLKGVLKYHYVNVRLLFEILNVK